jgi:ABC-type transport system involved in cytochrome bd biosynthesis fused ATPase/permease subunit
MQAIEALGRELTILIVAHRITTLQQCDLVVELTQGRVNRHGSYSSILEEAQALA